MRGLTDKRVLVTGGARGIGLSAVRAFLGAGARVVALDRDREALDEIEKELAGLRGTICADVADPDAVAAAFRELDEQLRGVDVLINNAGVSVREPFVDVTPENWRRVIDVNLGGVFFVAQQAARRMLRQGGGVILNVGSVSGMTGMPYYAPYNSSKAGVIELTRSMALELAPAVRVNAVCPGYVLTPMQEAEYTAEKLRECADKIPLRRLGRPEEIAHLMAFLASDEAAFMTGQTYVIDGGELAGGLASR